MKQKLFLPMLFCIFLFFSCDILRTSHFEILSWSPGEGYHNEPENIVISLLFSHEPNKASVERGFSLTGDGSRIRGYYFWEDKLLTFIPLSPLKKNTDYIINLSADAYDLNGLSMDEVFIRDFTTRQDNTRPELISFFPLMYAEIDNPRMEVKLEFSIPVLLKTLYDGISFTPSMTGFWILDNDCTNAIFTPSEPWFSNTRYEIRFNTSLTDINQMNIRNELITTFTTKTDQENPFLENAYRVTKEGTEVLLEINTENHDWEKDDKILLVFSKPVDSATVKNCINLEDGPGVLLESYPGFNTNFIFKLENIPVYESRFTIKIKSGIKDITGNESKADYSYKIFANGSFSKPPVLCGIRIPLSPNNETDKNPVFYNTDSLFQIIPISDNDYPSGEVIKTWIEFYFLTAEGASIDLFSLMEYFRIETSNNVISFLPRFVKTDNFSMLNPQNGYENIQRIEIAGDLTNSTNFGIINILIAAGLKDNLGNQNDKTQKISLIK